MMFSTSEKRVFYYLTQREPQVRTLIKVLYFLAGFLLVGVMNVLPIRASEYDRTSMLRLQPALEYKNPILSQNRSLCLSQGSGLFTGPSISSPVYTDQGMPFITQETTYHVCGNQPVIYIGSLIANSVLGAGVVLGVAWLISKITKGAKNG